MTAEINLAGGAMRTPRAFRALRYRNARIFFAGLLVSNVGTWLQLTAMSLLVYRITGRSTDVGVTVACQFLPMLLLGAWAGAVADQRDKRTLAIITQSGLAVQAVALGLIDLAGHASLGVVYGLSLVLGLVNAFDNPARRGLVVELVDRSLIANATSLNTAVMTGSRIFGPALAALFVGTIGTAWCFLINGFSFAAVLVSLFLIRPSEMFPSPLRARAPGAVREALRFIASRREMVVVFVVLVLVSTFAFNYAVSLPKLADERWGGEGGFGWVLGVMSIGSLIGSLLTARFDQVTMRWYLGMTLLLGASGLMLAWAPTLWIAFVWSVPVGIGGAGFITSVNALTQQDSPADMRGRLLAFTAVAFLGSTPIGGPITGVVGDAIGAEWALAYGSVVALVAVAWAAVTCRRWLPAPGSERGRTPPACSPPGSPVPATDPSRR